MPEYKYIFGPVPSRRLGRSLGVDLVPLKTCTYDCIYCQVGITTDKTITRKEYVPTREVLKELREILEHIIPPDYITLSGSGEPTLHSKLGEIIKAIKEITHIPVAVLTNGSLLWMPEVRNDLKEADLVIPSLDVGDQELFQKVNRPHPNIGFEQMIQGLIDFCGEYEGEIWLEVLLLRDITDKPEDVQKIAELGKKLNPHKIQINTATRPSAVPFSKPVTWERLQELKGIFGDKSEIIVSPKSTQDKKSNLVNTNDILSMLHRRPCSLLDVAQGLCISEDATAAALKEMLRQNLIEEEMVQDTIYYKALAKS